MGVKMIKTADGKVKMVSDQPAAGNPAVLNEDGYQTMDTVEIESDPNLQQLPKKESTMSMFIKKPTKPLEVQSPKASAKDWWDDDPVPKQSPSQKLMKNTPKKNTNMLNLNVILTSLNQKPVWPLTQWEQYENIMKMTKDFCLKFIYGTSVVVSVPQYEFETLMPASTALSDMQAVIGKLVDWASTGHGTISLPAAHSYDGDKAHAVLLGGNAMGEVRGITQPLIKVTTAEPMTFSAPSFNEPPGAESFPVEVYRLEQVAIDLPQLAHTHIARVYVHDSVPQERRASLFQAALEEFPLLRVIPEYVPFWKGWQVSVGA